MADYTGKIVLVEHPLMMDQYAVATVDSETAKMVTLRYWNRRTLGWGEPKKRAKSGIIRVLRDNLEDLDTDMVDYFVQRMISAENECTQRIRKARLSLVETVKKMELHG